MFYDVYRALQHRKKSSESVLANVANLKNCIAAASGESCASNTATESIVVKDMPRNETTTALKVCSLKSENGIVLFNGQRIKTSMGDALVVSIHPQEERVVLRLSFGTLYSSLRQVVTWIRSKKQLIKHDENFSDDCLRQRWMDLHSTGGLLIPQEVCEGISELVGQGEEEPGTDGDEDSANDEAFVDEKAVESNADIMRKGEDIPCGAGIETERQDVETPSAAAAAAETSSPPVPALRGELDRVPSTHSFPLKCFNTAAGSSVSANGTLSRQSLKSLLCPTGDACPSAAILQPFPLVFAPPGDSSSLPSIILQQYVI